MHPRVLGQSMDHCTLGKAKTTLYRGAGRQLVKSLMAANGGRAADWVGVFHAGPWLGWPSPKKGGA
jgi:hypothetical protein